MPKRFRGYLAALLLLSACQNDPQQKPSAAPAKSPHAGLPSPKPKALPATLPTTEAAENVLNDLMKDPNPGLKIVAVRAWSGLKGPASDAALQKALYESDAMTHTIAAAALAQRGDLSGLPLLEESLQSEVSGASGIVVTALRKLSPEKATPALKKCLSTKAPSLMASCAAALAHLGDKKGEEQLAILAKLPITANDVAKNLRFMPEPLAMTMLASLLEQDNSFNEAKELGLIASTSFGPPLDTNLRKALASPEPLIKGLAAAILLARGQDADPSVVAAALKTKQGPQLFSVLGGRLKKPDARLLPAVWLALEGDPEGFPFAFQILQHAIDNKVNITDTKTLHALLDKVPNLTGNFPANIKPASAPTKQPTSTSKPTPSASQPAPVRLSEEEAKKLRAAQGAATLAAAYLAALGDPRGVETMKKLLFWPNPSPAWVPAIEALQGDAAFPVILLAAKHQAAEIRAAAVPAIVAKAKSGDKEAYELLQKLALDEAPNVRQAVLKDAAVFSEKDADPIVRLALTDRLYAVRLTAAIAVLSRNAQATSQPDEE